MSVNVKKIADSNGFTPIPNDRYTLTVEKATFGSTTKGDPMAKVVFVVVDGKLKNRKLFVNYFFSEKTIFFTVSLLKVLGSKLLENDSEISERAITEEINNLAGVQFSAYVEVTVSDKGTNYKLTNYKAMESEDVDVLSALPGDENDAPEYTGSESDADNLFK